MAGKIKQKPYKIIGAYDSETTNMVNGTDIFAFPVSHQLGVISGNVEDITPDNVHSMVDVSVYRHALELNMALQRIIEDETPYVPVMLCHNLAFDMYGLSSFFDGREVRVLAKSQRKPITFTVLDDAGKPCFVIWDTLVFSQQPLERMGEDAGYKKAVGQWDYNRIRCPQTPLTDNELVYAKDDIYSLLTWVSWWLKRNPEIPPNDLGLRVVTKTGVVRYRRKYRFSKLKNGRYNVGRQWHMLNQQQAPKTDDELFTMQAATRGGFTFCASATASIPFDLAGTGKVVAAYDATSQHPAQMVSHRYPVGFEETSQDVLMAFLKVIRRITPQHILDNWSKPFSKAIYGAYTFTNLRPKHDSLFARNGIFPLASARFHVPDDIELDEDNGDAQAHEDNRREHGYCDTAVNPVYAFGKLVNADSCTVYVTELALWEICQAYEWDDVKAEHGYMTGRFVRPTDMSVISVMQFYQAKNEFKDRRAEYLKTGMIQDGAKLRALGIPDTVVSDMEKGVLSINDLEAQYLSLKADLNALFGIEASNEYRRDTVLTEHGIEYTGEFGVKNAPKSNKAWYQFGQRIVGWSRIAQICVMHLLSDTVDAFINGDTDSIKVLCDESALGSIDARLAILAGAIDRGKEDNCARVKRVYPRYHDALGGIGHYVLEFTTKQFCAAWNKAYCECEDGEFSFTLAGIPTRDIWRKDDSGQLSLYKKRINGIAGDMLAQGVPFSTICNKLLGYNVTFSPDVTGLNVRKFPEWGQTVYKYVTDYRGDMYMVAEPMALALYSMPKTIGSTAFSDNRANVEYALKNNPNVNIDNILITKNGIVETGLYET